VLRLQATQVFGKQSTLAINSTALSPNRLIAALELFREQFDGPIEEDGPSGLD
jgi:hypothetical protein